MNRKVKGKKIQVELSEMEKKPSRLDIVGEKTTEHEDIKVKLIPNKKQGEKVGEK
jgi:hypothetical protein